MNGLFEVSFVNNLLHLFAQHALAARSSAAELRLRGFRLLKSNRNISLAFCRCLAFWRDFFSDSRLTTAPKALNTDSNAEKSSPQ